MTSPTPEQIADDYRLLCHETGHAVLAGHFGIYAQAKVFRPEERFPESYSNANLIGGTCLMASSGTKFERAVIAWGGVLAEYIMGGIDKPSIEIAIPLSRGTLREFHASAMCGLSKFTISDQTMIAEYGASWWTPFKSAFRILTRQKRKLKKLVALQQSVLAKNQNPHAPIAPGTPIDGRIKFLEDLLTANPAHAERAFWTACIAALKGGLPLPDPAQYPVALPAPSPTA